MTAEAETGTFVFVDLAGFTALTEAHGDDSAADLAGRFAALARSELRTGESLVKSIGDAVMLRAPDPAAGLALVGRICGRADTQQGFPELRAGLHHGAAVHRDGDWFGAAVNLTARVAAEAGPGQVLCTAVVAEAARANALPVSALGARRLRHVAEPVDLFAVVPCPAVEDRGVDPVCHMAVLRREAQALVTHGGIGHVFCSARCADAFRADPARYLACGDTA